MSGLLVALLLVSALCFAAFALAPPAHGQSLPVATLKVTKSIPSVSLENVVTFKLTVENNGTIAVSGVEVYEYVNTALAPLGGIRVTSPTGDTTIPLASGGVATASQVIVDPPPPATLSPGQSLSLEYRMKAPSSGDFQVPASLVWFEFLRGSSTLRSSYYSNGLILHVPSGFEKVIIIIFPYVVAMVTFASTLAVLIWTRSRLRGLKK